MRKLMFRKPVLAILGLALVAALVVSVMALTGGDDRAEAAVIPPGCTGGGIQQSLNRTPAVAHVGDTVTYTMQVFNGPFPDCQITDIVATFTTPDGVAEVLPVPSTLNPGDSSGILTRTYVISAADVSGGVVLASLYSEGQRQDTPVGSTDTWDYDEAVTTVVEPCLEVTKEVEPTISKEGDEVEYTICVENCGDIDLERISVIDDVLGDKSADFEDMLPVGGSECEQYLYTIPPGADDPLVNTVTATYWDGWALPPEIAWTLVETASAEVDLVHPDFEISKECSPDPVGLDEDITWDVTVENTGDVALDIHVVDPTAGIDQTVVVAAGASETITSSRAVTVADVPAIDNTATATATLPPELGLDNVIGPKEASDSCEVEVHPCLEVTKEVEPTTSKEGDEVVYEICVFNCGDVDLELISVIDDVLGDKSADFEAILPVMGSECEQYPYTIPPGAPDPLVNTVTAHYRDVALGEDWTATASAEVDLVHPDFEISKECRPDPVNVGEDITWAVTLENTGDVALHIHVVDPTAGIDQTVVVAAGASETITSSRPVTDADAPAISNTATATATLPPELGLDNVIGPKEASDSCEVPVGEATRTPGFWMTHYDYTIHVFEVHLGGSIDLGWKILDSPEDVFGMFWASNTRECDGSRRDKVCQAQVIGSFQLLAAILNTGLDNGAPVPIDPVTGDDLITAMRAALAAGDRAEILRLNELLDAYNNSGDDVDIEDNDGYPILPADPKAARNRADTSIADCS